MEDLAGCASLDLDTPMTENLLETLWPGVDDLRVNDLNEDSAVDSWGSDNDFDLLFPDLA